MADIAVDRIAVKPGEFERMSDEELQQFIEATTLTLLALPGG
jgi:hypothetical protein